MKKTLATRILDLNTGYQGMDDQQSIAAAVKELEDKLSRSKDTIHELEQNLLAAQDQNHYFTLMSEYRDKFYWAGKMLKEAKEFVVHLRQITDSTDARDASRKWVANYEKGPTK